MIAGVLNYKCIKCGKNQTMDYFPDVRTGKYNQVMVNMFDSKLCKDCYIEEYVPEAAENLMILLGV